MNSATPNSHPEPEPAVIRATREAAGLSQTAAGAIVHTTCRTWQQWEAGDRRMHPAFWELFLLKTRRNRRQGR
jgi:DNA-binding transcriptional regulator YiaG